jgi:hypothetical protein
VPSHDKRQRVRDQLGDVALLQRAGHHHSHVFGRSRHPDRRLLDMGASLPA